MNKKESKVLFITRRFPPSIGGIENYSQKLHQYLSSKIQVKLISLGRSSKIHLIWFFPYSIVKAIALMLFKNYRIIYFTDGVAAVLSSVLKIVPGTRFFCTIHGLEVTYKNPVIHKIIMGGINNCEKVVAISLNTKHLLVEGQYPIQKIELIYTGIEPIVVESEQASKYIDRLKNEFHIDLRNEKYILNVGRMIKRKGVLEFLKNGLSLLDNSIKVIICGTGPDYEEIRDFCNTPEVKDQVKVIHLPSDNLVSILRQFASLFILPNVSIAGDVEGFGMSQLESMYFGTPVVAFAVDAIPESVKSGGYLVSEGDYLEFTKQINSYFQLSKELQLLKRNEALTYVRNEFSWERAASEYENILTKS